jgi:hypothetical protein
MIHTITVAPLSSTSSAGDPSFGSQTTIKGRVEHKSKLVVADNQEVQAEHRIVSEVEIDRESRIWLPGDDTTKQSAGRRVITTGEADTTDGYTLYETYL